MKFTEKQLENYRAYETVRQSGVINMLDSKNGCALSGLTPDEYKFVLSNYSELKKQADN